MTRKLGKFICKTSRYIPVSGRKAFIMDKNEILEKARSENKDEMEIFIMLKSMRLIFVLMEIFACFIAVNSAVNGKPWAVYLVIVNAPAGAGFLYRYIKIKKKFNLAMFICCVLATVCLLAFYAAGH